MEKQRNARDRNIFKNSEKNTIFNEHPVPYCFPLASPFTALHYMTNPLRRYATCSASTPPPSSKLFQRSLMHSRREENEGMTCLRACNVAKLTRGSARHPVQRIVSHSRNTLISNTYMYVCMYKIERSKNLAPSTYSQKNYYIFSTSY